MNAIDIAIREKIATKICDTVYICGNSDFVIRFDFDEEWAAYEAKTARFVTQNNEHMDIPFVGKECEVPIFSDVHNFRVGVFAGNLHTTTSAYVPCKKSILCGTGDKPIAPKEDAYDKMMEDINADAVRAETAANKAEEKLADMQERYYTPSVNEAGDLSWEANDEGMPEVPTVNIKGQKGDKGDPGEDGYSPTVGVSTIDGGHRVRFVDKNGAVAMNVMDGQDGQDGQDGVSPNVTVQPITGGNRVTFTDANGTKTFDVMNGEPGKPGENAENDELFIVRFSLVDGTWQTDHTYYEINAAKQEGKTLLAVGNGRVYSYSGEFADTGHLFTNHHYESGVGIVENLAKVASDNTAKLGTYKPTTTPNPKKLTIVKGNEEIGYDGSKAVTVEIPEGSGGSGLPTGGEPHQMLVTDKDGNATWEDRTHWMEEGMVEILPETAVAITEEMDGQGAIAEPFTTLPVAGQEYTVTWNGVEYTCVAEDFEMPMGDAFTTVFHCLGNVAAIGGATETDAPFLIVALEPDAVQMVSGNFGSDVYGMVILLDGSTEAIFKIAGEGTVYHRIDQNYLPEYLYGIIEGEDAVCLPEMTLDCNGEGSLITEPFVKRLLVGETYLVEWNGVQYVYKGQTDKELEDIAGTGAVAIGNLNDTSEPFLIVQVSPAVAAESGIYAIVYTIGESTSVTLSITQSGDIIRKMPEKFMPDSVMEKLNAANPIIKGENDEIYSDNIDDRDSVTGNYAIALGYNARANGGGAVAVGRDANAYGDESVAIKGSASGSYAVALGYNSYARGRFSFAVAGGDAYRDGAVAVGEGTWAYSADQVVLGKYNVVDEDGKYRYILGNGTSGSERSNAHTIDWDGNAWYAGDVFVGGTSQNDAKKLATEEYVKNYIEETLLGGAW